MTLFICTNQYFDFIGNSSFCYISEALFGLWFYPWCLLFSLFKFHVVIFLQNVNELYCFYHAFTFFCTCAARQYTSVTEVTAYWLHKLFLENLYGEPFTGMHVKQTVHLFDTISIEEMAAALTSLCLPLFFVAPVTVSLYLNVIWKCSVKQDAFFIMCASIFHNCIHFYSC